MTRHKITLAVADSADLPAFKRELQEAFAVAVVEEFGALPDGPIPSDEDLDASIAAPGTVTLRILADGRSVGGAVVTIDESTHHDPGYAPHHQLYLRGDWEFLPNWHLNPQVKWILDRERAADDNRL